MLPQLCLSATAGIVCVCERRFYKPWAGTVSARRGLPALLFLHTSIEKNEWMCTYQCWIPALLEPRSINTVRREHESEPQSNQASPTCIRNRNGARGAQPHAAGCRTTSAHFGGPHSAPAPSVCRAPHAAADVGPLHARGTSAKPRPPVAARRGVPGEVPEPPEAGFGVC